MTGTFFLEYMNHERVPAAGGDVLVLRLDGMLKTVDPDSPMEEIEASMAIGHRYKVTIEEGENG
jgi:hypothetical protein